MITIIVLWILLGIIAVIVILLHFSITAQIDLNKKGFDLKVRYMFFDIYPRKPKKKKQKRSKKAELPEDSFDDFEEFEDNIEESLPIPQTDDTTDKKGEVSEQIIEAKPEKIEKNEADENIRKGNNYSDGLLLSVQADVSDLKNKTTKNTASSSILQIIPFTSTIRWEVDYIQKKGRLETIYNSFKYQEYCINDLQKESLFGLSVKASLDKKNGMIPVLRMSNVINGELDFSTLKYLPADCASTEKEPQKWILRKGDFLITRTNGSKDLIGKAAIFNSDETYTYASYLIRYRFDTTIVLPEYVNILFMTPLVREQIAVMRRQGGGQYNLNSDEIGAIRLPVPSIPIPKQIIKKFFDAKDEAQIYYVAATKCQIEAAVDFEKEIFP